MLVHLIPVGARLVFKQVKKLLKRRLGTGVRVHDPLPVFQSALAVPHVAQTTVIRKRHHHTRASAELVPVNHLGRVHHQVLLVPRRRDLLYAVHDAQLIGEDPLIWTAHPQVQRDVAKVVVYRHILPQRLEVVVLVDDIQVLEPILDTLRQSRNDFLDIRENLFLLFLHQVKCSTAQLGEDLVRHVLVMCEMVVLL